MEIISGGFMFLLALVGFFFYLSVKILNEYERAVIFRLGRVIGAKGPGLIILIPLIDRMVRVDLRTITLDVPPQDVISKDNVTIKVNAVVYFRVVDPNRAVIEVENYLLVRVSSCSLRLKKIANSSESGSHCCRSETPPYKSTVCSTISV
jgi:regulator of protease activity HflC (stomatin/prohibitin superfamily)